MLDFYVISLFFSYFFNYFMLTKILPNQERINTCELISQLFHESFSSVQSLIHV